MGALGAGLGVAAGGARRWAGAGVRRQRERGVLERASAGSAAGGARGLATGCALGALGLFSIRIDSVLFLSRFLDIVRELGS